MNDYVNTIIHSDAISGQCELQNKSVHCIVTSPPYFRLRDYKTPPYKWPVVTYSIFGFQITVPEMTCELGQEPSPKAFIGHLVLIFREGSRVLMDDGTLWVNLGDSYASGPKNRTVAQASANSTLRGGKSSQEQSLKQASKISTGIKAKDLIGIPWMFAYAMRDDGWYLRQDIIWAKPNGMPESVTDRCTKSHEYIFMFSKSKKYYYDAESIKTQAKESSLLRASQDTSNQFGGVVPGKTNGNMKAVLKNLVPAQANIRKARDKQRGHSRKHNGFNARWDQMTREEQQSFKANKRSVWTVPTAQYHEDHFAVFPEKLIWDMIMAGCPVGGVVLDPFFGRGTTGVVARKQDKNYIGVELLKNNIRLAEKFINKELTGYQRKLFANGAEK